MEDEVRSRYLSWIDDNKLINAINSVSATFKRVFDRPTKSETHIDPLTITFEKSLTGRVQSRRIAVANMVLRDQTRKFHAEILDGYLGWHRTHGRHYRQLDLINNLTRACAIFRSTFHLEIESWIKNLTEEYPDFKVVYIVMTTTSSHSEYHYKFEKQIFALDVEVKILSMEEFYDLLTETKGALAQLIHILPSIIKEVAMKPVFLSYTRRDIDTMRLIRDALINTQVEVWTDENLDPGTAQWQQKIENAIMESGCVVVILSPEARKSEWVQTEISFSRVQGKRILPIIIAGDETNAIPIQIINEQRFDATKNFDIELEKLVAFVQNYLRDLRGL